jgi:hypothetical protein
MNRREIIRSLVSLAVGAAAISTSGAALARIGRPLSPGSIGGVRRRTRRRTRRRVRRRMAVGMSMATLPYGCVNTMMRGGTSYYYCAGIWYRPTYQGTTVVYVVDTIDAGADTNVEFEEE